MIAGSLASALIPHVPGLVSLEGLWAVESLGYTASVPAERAFVADIPGKDIRVPATAYIPSRTSWARRWGHWPVAGCMITSDMGRLSTLIRRSLSSERCW